jgi:hypothetical protein
VRLRTVGFRGFEGDDYLAFVVSFRDIFGHAMHLLRHTESFVLHWRCGLCSHRLSVTLSCSPDYWPNSIPSSDFTGTNVDVLPDMLPHLSDEEIATVSYGSKMQLAAWYTYTALICTSAPPRC